MNSVVFALLFVLCVFVSSCTQIALKRFATQQQFSGFRIYFNRTVILSNLVFVGVTLITVILYKYIQLSTATLLNSTSYIYVLILNAIFLKEKIGKRKIIGIVFILIGVSVYALFDGAI